MTGRFPKETVLVIEDDRSLAGMIRYNLDYEGYQVLMAHDGETGLSMAIKDRPDLVLLDWMLPGIAGPDILKEIRREGLEMEVLFLTARTQDTDAVKGLSLGADDYITKPVALPILLARIDAALRRGRKARAVELPITFGDVEISATRHTVTRGGEAIELTAREFDLLVFLARHPDRVFPRIQLLREVWGFDYDGTERTVDNFIRAIRLKIEADPATPKHILTVHGVGYRFVPSP